MKSPAATGAPLAAGPSYWSAAAASLNTFTTTALASGAVPRIELAAPRRARKQITDISSGVTGFITYQGDGAPSIWVVIDRNDDGEIDIAGDRTAGAGANNWEFRQYTSEVYGSRYIRWANMQWCRQ